MSCVSSVPESHLGSRAPATGFIHRQHAKRAPHASSKPREAATRLFIARLSPYSTAQSVRAYFFELLANAGHMAPHEAITDVYLPMGPGRKSRGFAFVSLADDESLYMVTSQPVHSIDGKVVVIDTAAPRDTEMGAPAPSFTRPRQQYPVGIPHSYMTHEGMYPMLPFFQYNPYTPYWIPAYCLGSPTGQGSPMVPPVTSPPEVPTTQSEEKVEYPDTEPSTALVSEAFMGIASDARPTPYVDPAAPPATKQRRRMKVKLSRAAFSSPTSSVGSIPTPIVQMIQCALMSPI